VSEANGRGEGSCDRRSEVEGLVLPSEPARTLRSQQSPDHAVCDGAQPRYANWLGQSGRRPATVPFPGRSTCGPREDRQCRPPPRSDRAGPRREGSVLSPESVTNTEADHLR